jgi:hypothetical protein
MKSKIVVTPTGNGGSLAAASQAESRGCYFNSDERSPRIAFMLERKVITD